MEAAAACVEKVEVKLSHRKELLERVLKKTKEGEFSSSMWPYEQSGGLVMEIKLKILVLDHFYLIQKVWTHPEKSPEDLEIYFKPPCG